MFRCFLTVVPTAIDIGVGPVGLLIYRLNVVSVISTSGKSRYSQGGRTSRSSLLLSKGVPACISWFRTGGMTSLKCLLYPTVKQMLYMYLASSTLTETRV